MHVTIINKYFELFSYKLRYIGSEADFDLSDHPGGSCGTEMAKTIQIINMIN